MVARNTPADQRPKIVTPELVAVICIVGLAGMAMALLQPVLPLYLTGIGVNPTLLGLMFSSGMLGMVLGESTGGWLADRVGIKVPLVIGTFVCAPLVLSFVFITHPALLFVVFFIWGIVRAAIFGPGRGIIGTRIPLARKATFMAIYAMSMSVFRGAASFSSGFIADNLGYDWVFYSASAVGVVAGIMVIVFVKRSRNKPQAGGDQPSPADGQRSEQAEAEDVPLYRNRLFITQSAVAFFFFAANGLGAFVSLLGVEVVGVAATQVGILFTIGAVTNAVMLVPMGRLADRHSKRNMMVIGLIVTAAGQATVGLSHGFPQMIAGMIVQSCGGATFGPAAVALLSETVPPQRQNTAMGVYGGFEDAGVILSSAMGGVVWSVFGPSWTFLVVGALCAVIGAVIAFLLVKDRRKQRAPELAE
jgi:MFS transporter, PPP family, 3-phenylpropionic acid transporter